MHDLHSYFLFENNLDQSFARWNKAFSELMTVYFMLFTQSLLPTFMKPLIFIVLIRQMQSFINKLASKLIKTRSNPASEGRGFYQIKHFFIKLKVWPRLDSWYFDEDKVAETFEWGWNIKLQLKSFLLRS